MYAMTHREAEAPPKRVRYDASPTIMALAALVMATTGLLIELKPVSLTTGDATLYTGLAIAAGAAVLAIGVRARLWLRIFTVGLVGFCMFNFIQTTHVLDQQRDQMKYRIDKLGSDLSNELPRG
jgi:hypothetical protein